MNDFIAGLIGGTSGLVVGHPFDTIKTLMQARHTKSIFGTTEFLIKEKKGLMLPFIFYGPMNSVLFGIYGNTLKYLENDNKKDPSLKNIFIAGSIAGTIVTIPTNPLELVKIQLQTHNRSEMSGVVQCINKIYKENGLKGFFRGTKQLIYRDSFSYGFYFYAFEFLRRKGKENGFNSPVFNDLVCGGLAGSLTWLLVMPIDVIKTKLQADIDKKITSYSITKSIWATEGLKGFYKGVTVVMIRGFIVNSVTFCMYIQTLKFLNKNKFYV